MVDISSSSSSSEDLNEWTDSSDDEIMLVENRARPKNQDFLEQTVSRYNNQEFMEHFRISRRLMAQIVEQYQNADSYKHHSGIYGEISASSQILIFLWFSGHATASFRDVADRFNISMSSLFRIIKRVTHVLSNLSPQTITWPSHEENREIEMFFHEKHFPGVIGAIDGTHIRIDKPEIDPDSYLNRKKYYSLHMQAVCDNKMKIRDIFIGYPGPVHDSRVFRTSSLADSLPQKCGNNYFILGDSGYPCQRHLITPFKDRGHLTRAQKAFNSRISTNRYVIEHCFGILKQKFRQLYHIKLRKIDNIVHFIRAYCVLHNLALDDGFEDAGEPLGAADIPILEENVNIPDIEEEGEIRDDINGVLFRNQLLYDIL